MTTETTSDAIGLDALGVSAARIRAAVETVIEGKPDVVRLALTVLLAEGHLLIEDVPGVGKTMLAKSLARALDCPVRRIQFTPDLLPSDVTGVSVYNQENREFEFKPGAIFANIVVGDEINRASPKTQSALLECMEERQVTVDGTTYVLSAPFMVIATQNPIEMEGTYPLPEAQRDRFMARVSMGYPDGQAELAMIDSHAAGTPLDDLEPVADAAEIVQLIEVVQQVHVSPSVGRYAVALVVGDPHVPGPAAGCLAARDPAPAARGQGRRGAGRPRLRAARRRAEARRAGAGPPAPGHRRGADRPPWCSADRGGHRGADPAAGRWLRRRATGDGMRQALRGLTTRGRCFLGAGGASALCALLFGQRDLLRVAVLVAALPLVSAVVVARTRYRIASSRRLEPARAPVGSDARVVLRLENVSRLPTGLLLLEDRIPYVLGARPRFVLDRVEPRGTRDVAYSLRSEVRGRFALGPLSIRLTDPFGMCELVRSFTSTDDVRRHPGGRDAARAAAGRGLGRQRRVQGPLDRLCRRGRRRHPRVPPRATTCAASTGGRRRTAASSWCAARSSRGRAAACCCWTPGCTAHRGDGPASSFEVAVSAAASLGVHLGRSGFTLDLVTDAGRRITASLADQRGEQEDTLLDALAVVEPSTNRSLQLAGPVLRSAGEGLTVAVLGALTVDEAAELVRYRHGAGSVLAVALDVESWRSAAARERAPRADPSDPVAVLRGAGWRVVTLSAGQRLADVWPYVASSPVSFTLGVGADGSGAAPSTPSWAAAP